MFKDHFNFFIKELSIHVFSSFFYWILSPWFSLSVKFEPTTNLDKGWKHSTKTWLSGTISEWVADLAPRPFSVYFLQRHPLCYHNTTIQIRKASPKCLLLKQNNSVQNRWLHVLVISFFPSVILSLTPTVLTLLKAPRQSFWRKPLTWVCLILHQD